jgi:hypothetical protein
MKFLSIFLFLMSLHIGVLTLSGAAQSQDSLEGYGDHFTSEDGAWNTAEEALQDAAINTLYSTPSGALLRPLAAEMYQGEDDPEPEPEPEPEPDNNEMLILGFVVAIMLAAWLIFSDFVELLRSIKQKATKAIIGKILTIVVTFLSAWIPGWNIFFMVVRVILKVVKIIRMTKRVAQTVNAASKAVIKH